MKTIIKTLIPVIVLLLSTPIFAQEVTMETKRNSPKVKSFRIGGKIGFPNLVGGNVEYVTPLLGHKLAVAVDYSSISNKSIDQWIELEDEFKVTYYEGGLNYYLFSPGSGLYAGISYGALKADVTIPEIESEEQPEQYGSGHATFSHSSFNVKLGAKMGGTIYFRPEIGYSFTKLPEEFDITANFPDGSSESQTEEIPISEYNKGYIFNIGIGLAF